MKPADTDATDPGLKLAASPLEIRDIEGVGGAAVFDEAVPMPT